MRGKKRKYVHHRKRCTCMVVDIGYTQVYQITVDSGCPFHGHYLKGDK